MSQYQEKKRARRRRFRSIAFFDDGLDSAAEKPTIRTRKRVDEQQKRIPSSPAITSTGIWLLVSTAMAVIIMLSGLMLAPFCRNSLTRCRVCERPWFTTKAAWIKNLPEGTTLTTKTLRTITQLNEMSTALEYLGLAMQLIAINATDIQAVIGNQVSIVSAPNSRTDELTTTVYNTQIMVQTFSSADHFYRHNALRWQESGLNSLSLRIDRMSEVLQNDGIFTHEQLDRISHYLPFGRHRMLARSLTVAYLRFFAEQVPSVEELVLLAGQTRIQLERLIGTLGPLERRLEMGKVREIAPTLTMMRAEALWCYDVIVLADKRYKDLSQHIRMAVVFLEADMKAYGSVWPSASALPPRDLRQVIEIDAAQLAVYFQSADEHSKVLSTISKQWMEGDDPNIIIHKLEAASLKRDLYWW